VPSPSPPLWDWAGSGQVIRSPTLPASLLRHGQIAVLLLLTVPLASGAPSASPATSDPTMARRDTIAPLAAQYMFTEKRRSSGHRIWVHLSGAVVTTGSTPSDRRALKNVEAQFRRTAMMSQV